MQALGRAEAEAEAAAETETPAEDVTARDALRTDAEIQDTPPS